MKINDFILQEKMYMLGLSINEAVSFRFERRKMVKQLTKLSVDRNAEVLPGGKGTWVFVLANNKKIEKLGKLNAEISLLAVNHNSIKIVKTANKNNEEALYDLANKMMTENLEFPQIEKYSNNGKELPFLHREGPANEPYY